MFSRDIRREKCKKEQKATKRRRVIQNRKYADSYYCPPKQEQNRKCNKESSLDGLASHGFLGKSTSFGFSRKKPMKHKKHRTPEQIQWRRQRNQNRRKKRIKNPLGKRHRRLLTGRPLFPHILDKNQDFTVIFGQSKSPMLDMDGGSKLPKVEPDEVVSWDSNCSRGREWRRGGDSSTARTRMRGRDRRRSRSRSRRQEDGRQAVQPERDGDSKDEAATKEATNTIRAPVISAQQVEPPPMAEVNHGWGTISKLAGGMDQQTPRKSGSVKRRNSVKSAKRKLPFTSESTTPTKKPKIFYCPFEPCIKSYAFKHKLSEHIRFNHLNEDSTTSDANSDSESLFCIYCNAKFTLSRNRKAHERQACPYRHGIDNISNNDTSEESGIHSDELSPEVSVETSDPADVASVSSHVETFPCPLCSKVYPLKSSLVRHTKWTHRMNTSSSSDSENPSPHILPMTPAEDKIHGSSHSESVPLSLSSNSPINTGHQTTIPPISSHSTPSLTDNCDSSECTEMGSSDFSGCNRLLEDLKENKCSYCFTKFSNKYILNFHIQTCPHIPPQQNNSEPLIVFESLKRPENWKQIKCLLKQMPFEDQFSFCQLSKMNIPGIYPIAFNTNHKTNIVTRYCCNDPYKMLKLLLYQNPHILLPSHYIIQSEKKGTSSYIGPTHTTPKSNTYKVVHLENQISVSLTTKQDSEDLDSDDEDLDSDDDVIFVSDDECSEYSFEIPELLKPRNIEVFEGKCENNKTERILKDEQNKKESDDKYEDQKNYKSDDDKDEKSGDDDITYALSPNPHHSSSDDSNSSTNTMPLYRRIRHSLCRTPWHLSAEDIYALTNTTKERFMTQANNYRDGCVGGRTELDYRAQYLLFRMKLAHFYSEDQLCSSAFFALKSHEISINMFYKLLGHVYQNELAVPNILGPNAVNQAELNALFETAYRHTDPLYREIFNKFRDPLGLGRIGVPMLKDGTYIDFENSSDTELNKQLFFDPRSRKTVKVIAFVSSLGKVLLLLPPCASQSPASGDTVLLGTFLHTEDLQPVQMLRTIARGTQNYFPIFIGDAGFQFIPARLDLQGRFVDFRQVCETEGCIFLGTKLGEYLLRTQPVPGNPAETEIVKIDIDQNLPTSAQHTVKLIRFLRCKNENFHAGWSQKFQILKQHKLPQKYLEKVGPKLGGKAMGLPDELHDRPKLSFIVAVCAGLYNLEHPGFPVKHLNEAQQLEKAAQIVANLNFENPHLHNVDFGINLNLNSERNWRYVRSSQLRQNGFLGFPQLTPQTFQDQIYQLSSGVHSLLKGQSVLSHVRKLEVDEMANITYADYEAQLQLLPQNLKILYFDSVNRPGDWDDNLFGQWPGPSRIYRANLPPSNKSDTARNNWKQPTIVVADDPSINRLNCNGVFERINSYHCYSCPSLNGLLGMCCHLGALVILLSCPFLFRSTNKPVKLVNLKSRQEFQPTGILIPGNTSTPIPDLQRISRNTRATRAGVQNILYPYPNSPGQSSQSSSGGSSPRQSPGQSPPRQSQRQTSPGQSPRQTYGGQSPRQNSPGQTTQSPPRQNLSRNSSSQAQNASSSGPASPSTIPMASSPLSPQPSVSPTGNQSQLQSSAGLTQRQISPGQNSPSQTPQSPPRQNLSQAQNASGSGPASPRTIPMAPSPLNPQPCVSPTNNQSQLQSSASVAGDQQSDLHGNTQHPDSSTSLPSRSNDSGQLRPSDNTERYLLRLANRNPVHSIPPPTNYVSPSSNFLIGALQTLGLQNTANNCYANVVILGFHRIGITSLMFDPAFGGERLLMILRRIMYCFPSNISFSPEVFIKIWNSLGSNPFPLGAFHCAKEFLESLLSRFQNTFRANSLTKFPAFLHCQNCGLNEPSDNYQGLVSLFVGQIDVYGMANDETANIPSLLENWINRSFRTNCTRCNNDLPNTKLAPVKGKYTIVAINRSGNNSLIKSLTKLKIETNQMQQLTRELCHKPVYFISHIGSHRNGGHWVSFTESEGNYYRNNDSQRIILTQQYDPLNPSQNTETVDIVIFETI